MFLSSKKVFSFFPISLCCHQTNCHQRLPNQSAFSHCFLTFPLSMYIALYNVLHLSSVYSVSSPVFCFQCFIPFLLFSMCHHLYSVCNVSSTFLCLLYNVSSTFLCLCTMCHHLHPVMKMCQYLHPVMKMCHHLHSVIQCFITFTLLSSFLSPSICYPLFHHLHSVIHCFIIFTLLSIVSSSSLCYPLFHHIHSVIVRMSGRVFVV